MTKPTIRIHDTATDEVIDREMTNAEFAAYQAQQEENAAVAAQEAAKAAAKAAVLEKLGLSAEEMASLLG